MALTRLRPRPEPGVARLFSSLIQPAQVRSLLSLSGMPGPSSDDAQRAAASARPPGSSRMVVPAGQ